LYSIKSIKPIKQACLLASLGHRYRAPGKEVKDAILGGSWLRQALKSGYNVQTSQQASLIKRLA